MAHGLAAQLGGALTIASQLGVGTSVALWLPSSGEGAAAGRVAAEAGLVGRGYGAVLLVDDEHLARMITADMLNELDYAVTEAVSAEKALELIEGDVAFDMLVTNHLMLGITGVELANFMRVRHPDIPVLIVSNFVEMKGITPNLPRLAKQFRQADFAEMLIELRGLQQRPAF